ncbi:hypothetical protein GR236_34745 [Rhizobium leguminosarum]|uniref:hypothetical protein n=1 Tax=Rhizobium ruizarguesonis TaxID=2081791 RepID=UPI0013BFE8D4|nr:hypothetical protein [Rhizobium ruizarguesonis]NEK12975.1 hypothetical protein [Rhizobium ruizarguesonis]
MGGESSKFKWVVWGLVIAILGLGLTRILWVTKENTQYSSANVAAASLWAACLPSIPVDANSTIGLATLASELKTALGVNATHQPKIDFIATNDIAVDPIDPSISVALETTGELLLPEATEFRVRAGEFWLTGSVEARIKDGGNIILKDQKELRLKPADDQSYLITLPKGLKLPPVKAQSTTRMLEAGTRGVLALEPGKVVELKTLEGTAGTPLLFNTPAKLVPVRAFGEKGPSALTIETEFAQLDANNLQACAVSNGQTYVATITDVSSEGGSRFNITVRLPSDVLPELGFPAPIQIAVVSADGKFVGHGGLRAYPRLWGAMIASVLTAALFGAILRTRYVTTVPDAKDETDWGRWFSGLFISDGDKDPSLSLFQVFFWTVITVWGLFYTYAVTGSLLQMTSQMMILLGIAGTGSVLARWISLSQDQSTPQSATPAGTTEASYRFWDILNTRGKFDLLKLQLLVFTLLLGVYVICRIAESAAFPVLDTNTLLLLGVSQGVYIGGKLGGTAPLARAQAIQIELNVNNDAIAKLPSEIQNDKKSRDFLAVDKTRLENERNVLQAAAGDPAAISKKTTEIQQVDTSIAQLDAAMKEKQARLDAATTKAVELKGALEKILKEDLRLQTAN